MLGVWGGNRGPGGKYSRVYVFGHLRTNCPNSGTSSGPLRSFQLWEYLYLKPSQGGDSFRADQLLGSPSGMNVISRFYSWWLMHTFSFLAILLLITYLMTKMFAVKYVTCSCAQTYWLGNFINVKRWLFKTYCLCLYDAALWSQYILKSIDKFQSCYNKCIKLFFWIQAAWQCN